MPCIKLSSGKTVCFEGNKYPDGDTLKFEPGGEVEKQKQWLISYVKSPMYKERLKTEFPGKDDAFINAEAQARLNNLSSAKTNYVHAIDKKPGYVSGVYMPKNYQGSHWNVRNNSWEPNKFTPSKFAKGNVYFEQEYKPSSWNPYLGFETIPLHEFGHVLDDGGFRIPKSTQNKIFNYTTRPTEDYQKSYKNSSGQEFTYESTPSEFINRIQPIRYLLNNQNIYDARKSKFTEQDYIKMMNNSKIKENVHFQDVMNSLKGDDNQKKKAFIDIMNTVAMQNDSNLEPIADIGIKVQLQYPPKFDPGGKTGPPYQQFGSNYNRSVQPAVGPSIAPNMQGTFENFQKQEEARKKRIATEELLPGVKGTVDKPQKAPTNVYNVPKPKGPAIFPMTPSVSAVSSTGVARPSASTIQAGLKAKEEDPLGLVAAAKRSDSRKGMSMGERMLQDGLEWVDENPELSAVLAPVIALGAAEVIPGIAAEVAAFEAPAAITEAYELGNSLYKGYQTIDKGVNAAQNLSKGNYAGAAGNIVDIGKSFIPTDKLTKTGDFSLDAVSGALSGYGDTGTLEGTVRGSFDNSVVDRGAQKIVGDKDTFGRNIIKENLKQAEQSVNPSKFNNGGYIIADAMVTQLPKKEEGGKNTNMKNGINNPGFKSLPGFVQEKIVANMAMGGLAMPGEDDKLVKKGSTPPAAASKQMTSQQLANLATTFFSRDPSMQSPLPNFVGSYQFSDMDKTIMMEAMKQMKAGQGRNGVYPVVTPQMIDQIKPRIEQNRTIDQPMEREMGGMNTTDPTMSITDPDYEQMMLQYGGMVEDLDGSQVIQKFGKGGGITYRGHKFPGYNKPIKAPANDKHKKMVLVKKGDKIRLIKFGYSPKNKVSKSTKKDLFSPSYWSSK